MNLFPVVDCVARSYRFIWDSRALLYHYALLSFLVKAGCSAFVILFGLHDNILRAGLVSLPGYFAEGVFCAYVIYLAMGSMAGQGDFFNRVNRRTMSAGTVMYVLIQLVYVMIIALIVSEPVSDFIRLPEEAEFSPVRAVLSLVFLLVTLWSVRLSWLYVPLAMGFGLRRYLRMFRSMVVSFHMIGVTLLCSVPLGLVLIVLAEVLIPSSIQTAEEVGVMSRIILSVFENVAEVAYAAFASAAMVFALYPVLSGRKVVS